MGSRWIVEHVHGDAGGFHASDPVAQRSATFLTVAEPTLVLGSAQRDNDVDRRVADALGVEVVRRRSGGGAVLLLPGEFVWLDLVIPAGDELWLADVAQAMVWVGELWRAAFAELGIAGEVHRGPMITTAWSRQVCFAGVGTGELLQGVGKLVGVSQRRTREYARFQSMCHLRWRPEIVAALVAAPRPEPAQLATVTACAAGGDRLSQVLVDELALMASSPGADATR
jgi:lipoate-protein ligase A